MYTHCPHCDTCFRITSEQLKIARGSVRCGRCFGTFSALEHLVDEPPHPQATPPALSATPGKKPSPAPTTPPKQGRPAPIVTPKLKPALSPADPRPTKAAPTPPPAATPAPAAAARPTPPRSEVASTPPPATTQEPTVVARPSPPRPEVAPPVVTPHPEPKSRPEPKAEMPPPPAATADTSTDTPTPASEAGIDPLAPPPPGAQQPGHKRVWPWALATPLLLLLFISQYAWFNLESLAQQTSLRPALQTMCGLLDCEVPLIRSPHMITLMERNIRNHPQRKQVLQVKARIISKAPYPQPFPLMELSLHDITGKVLATRRFTPDEYLTPDINQKQGIGPQQLVDIMLELDDPGKEAVGFEFAFF